MKPARAPLVEGSFLMSAASGLTFVSGLALATLLAGCPTTDGDPEPTPEPAADAGTDEPDTDAGSEPDADGGEAEPDADGGSVVEDGGVEDGGVDAGPAAPCADVVLGADGLGSLTLGASTTVAANVASPDGIARVAFASNDADGFDAFGLDGTDVVELASWPDLVKGNVLFDVIAAEDAEETTFLSPYLVADSAYVAAGYTLFSEGVPGKVAFHTRGADTQHLNAPGNYTAALAAGSLLVDSLGLGDDTGAGVYVYNASLDGSSMVVDFAGVDFAGSGFCGGTADAIIAGYADSNFDNQLVGFTNAQLLQAGSSMTPLDPANGTSIYGGGVLDVASTSDAVVLLLGGYDANFNLVQERVVRIPLSVEGDLTVGTAEDLVVVDADGCTAIDSIAALGDDVVIQTRVGTDVQLVQLQEGM